MAFASRLGFSICPRINADADHLTASTSSLSRVLSLGLSIRHVVVDRLVQTVTIAQRRAWFFQRRRIVPFSHIAAVTYGYEDISPLSAFSSTHDGVDRFVVGLRVIGSDEVRLFDFVGDGVFTHDGPLPDWWYWDEYLVDFTGTQERESRLYVQLLSKLIGVTIVPSTLTRE